MPRIRSLKPEFCKSEAIAVLSIPCRLHFALLWTYADDEGRGVDHPKLIKAELWPLDDDISPEQIQKWQAELERKGRITRYEVAGKRFFEITNWSEHQHPNRPVPSRHPPCTHVGLTEDAVGQQGVFTPVVVEVEGGVEVEVVGVMAPVRARKPDLLWDAVMAECGVDSTAIPDSARGAYNKALKSLRSAGAQPEQVIHRANVFRRRWPEASVTPTSLARRWAEVDPATQNGQKLPKSAPAIAAVRERHT